MPLYYNNRNGCNCIKTKKIKKKINDKKDSLLGSSDPAETPIFTAPIVETPISYTISNINISGSNLTIGYKGGSPTPPPPPSGSGRCVKAAPNISDEYCESNCKVGGQTCTPDRCPKGSCKFIYNNPCLENPCKNGGTCTPSQDNKSFTCDCKKCYTGNTCEDISCAANSECTSGSIGCIVDTTTCKCICDKDNCYTKVNGNCELCATTTCPNGLIKNCNKGNCICIKGLPNKVLIGYWGTNQSPSLITAIQEGKYNVIMFTFGQFDSDGNFIWCVNNNTNPLCGDNNFSYPKGDEIKYIKDNNIPAFISLFGAAGSAPSKYTITASEWAKKAMDSISSQIDWINGVDLDLENTWGSNKTTEYIFEFFVEAKKRGYYTSMAPQTTSLDPSISTFTLNGGGDNGYYAFLTSKNINYWDLICPQLYNNSFAGGEDKVSAIKYANSLMSQSTLTYDTKLYPLTGALWEEGLVDKNKLVLKIPSEKLVLGFPASKCACSDGCSTTQGPPPPNIDTCKTDSGSYFRSNNEIKDIYDSLNKNIRGFMTWSIGWDWAQGPVNEYNFGKGVSSILQL